MNLKTFNALNAAYKNYVALATRKQLPVMPQQNWEATSPAAKRIKERT